jgi:sugar-phosphatase
MSRFECQAVLFDLDGVLVDSARPVERVWRAWAERHGLDAAQVVAVAHGRRTIETVRLFAPHLDAGAEAKELERAEIEDTTGLLKADGAGALLTILPPSSWAVVTSRTRALAMARLRHTGLQIPRVLVGAEDVKKGKPNPECYLKGAELLGAPAEQCVVVEDTPAGIQAACSAGMAVVAVATIHLSSELLEADAVVRVLSEVRLEVKNAAESDEFCLEVQVENRTHEN